MKTTTCAKTETNMPANGRTINISFRNTHHKADIGSMQFETPISRQLQIRLAASTLFVIALVLLGFWPDWSLEWLCSTMLFFNGLLCWTYLEYIVHRFYVHTRKPWISRACGWYPNRVQRVKILALWMTLLILGAVFNHRFFLAAGMVGGWLWYCYMRVFVQWNGMAKVLPGLHRQHLYHLAGGHDKGFGWTTTLWDTWFHSNVPMGYVYSPGHGRYSMAKIAAH